MYHHRFIFLLSLVVVCGCVGAGGAKTVNKPAAYAYNSSLVFRLYDNTRGEYAQGALLCQNWSGARIYAGGAILDKRKIVPGECAVALTYNGTRLYLPLEIDDDFLAFLNGTDEYVLRFNSKDFEKRYFLFVDENGQPLQGLLYLDGKMISQSDGKGIFAANLTDLHPGNITFRWVVDGNVPAEWTVNYIKSDMDNLFIRVPSDTRGLNITSGQ